MFNSILTTMDKYTEDETVGNIIDSSKTKGAVKEYQKVLAIGTTVRDIKVGDYIMINPIRYAVYKHQRGSLNDGVVKDNPVIGYNFPIVDIDDKQCLLLADNDVKYVITDFEDVKETVKLEVPKPKIIV